MEQFRQVVTLDDASDEASRFKVFTFTHVDNDTTATTVSLTFQPSAVIFIASFVAGSGTNNVGTLCGLDDGTTAGSVQVSMATPSNLNIITGQSVTFGEDGSDYCAGHITSITPTGITISWTLTGSPTGQTFTVYGLAIRCPSKLLHFTHNLATTGNEAHTGVGFPPRALLGIAGLTGATSSYVSVGIAEIVSMANGNALNLQSNATDQITAHFIGDLQDPAGIGTADADVHSFDNDGFTLNWTNANSPTGTQDCYVLCLSSLWNTITFTRDTSLASGTLTYSGVGFKAGAVIVLSQLAGLNYCGMGFTDRGTNFVVIQASFGVSGNTSVLEVSGNLIGVGTDNNNLQRGNIGPFRENNFDIAWTKAGTPTGTATMWALCGAGSGN